MITKKKNYKNKISEIEKNLREAEGKRGALLLELETEKAKWNIERDNFSNKQQELKDKISELEKRVETLLRDNEKLKNEKTIWKKNKNTESRLFTSHLGMGGLGSKKMESGSIYKSAMIKVLGDYSEEKEDNSKIRVRDQGNK